MQTVSLSNNSDFVVGRSDEGFFSGRLDFLRVSRGTMAQAETNIRELYSWEFNGPFLRDFFGRHAMKKRDVGAIEYNAD